MGVLSYWLSRLDETRGLAFVLLMVFYWILLQIVILLNRKLKFVEEELQRVQRDQEVLRDEFRLVDEIPKMDPTEEL